MNADELKRAIAANAKEITRLHRQIHETVRFRGVSEVKRREWEAACAEFHRRYDALAFPDGYKHGLTAIAAGEPAPIEAALCFLELRPYFFRSGYMYKALLRKVRHAALSPEQLARLQLVLERQARWRTCKAAHAAA